MGINMKTSERRFPTAGELYREMPSAARFIMKQILSLGCSFALAQIQAFGEFSPFALSFLAGVPADCILAAAIGACFGYIVTPAPIAPMRYIAAVISAAVISRSVRSLARKPDSAENAASFISFGCLLITGLAIIIPDKPVFTDIMLCIAESLLGGGASYFFSHAFALSPRKPFLKNFNSQELSCIAVTFSIIIMAFSEFKIGEIAPARILSVFIILICALCGKEAAGCISGLTLGAAMSLGGAPFLTAAYGLGGLLAGVFSPLGQFASAASFASVAGVAALSSGDNTETLYIIAETAVATIIFVAIPEKYMKKIKNFFARPESTITSRSDETTVSVRLSEASEAMKHVSSSVSTVAERLNRMQCPTADSIHANVKSQICENCPNNKICWGNDKNTECIISALKSFEKMLREGEIPTSENIPQSFAKQCSKLPLFIAAFQQEFAAFEVRAGAIRRLSELRAVVADQFEETAMMLDDLSKQFDKCTIYNNELSQEIERICPTLGFIPVKINCVTNSENIIRVELYGKFGKKHIGRAQWKKEISKIVKVPLNSPAVQNCGENVLISFTQQGKFSVYSAGSQLASKGGSLCGDAFEIFTAGDGSEILMISDGMGTGGRAAVDAALAAGLFSNLVQTGFELNTSLKTVNTALLAKSGDESFATLDIVKINKYTGQADFYKAGGAASFVRQNGVFKAVEIPSTPPGIFRNIEFQKASLKLNRGDIILLVSDGVLTGETAWIAKTLDSVTDEITAQETSDKIAYEAKSRYSDNRQDDITVVVGMIK